MEVAPAAPSFTVTTGEVVLVAAAATLGSQESTTWTDANVRPVVSAIVNVRVVNVKSVLNANEAKFDASAYSMVRV